MDNGIYNESVATYHHIDLQMLKKHLKCHSNFANKKMEINF